VYPLMAAQLTDLMARLEASDRAIERINARALPFCRWVEQHRKGSGRERLETITHTAVFAPCAIIFLTCACVTASDSLGIASKCVVETRRSCGKVRHEHIPSPCAHAMKGRPVPEIVAYYCVSTAAQRSQTMSYAYYSPR
jgi:hypothetical protein